MSTGNQVVLLVGGGHRRCGLLLQEDGRLLYTPTDGHIYQAGIVRGGMVSEWLCSAPRQEMTAAMWLSGGGLCLTRVVGKLRDQTLGTGAGAGK